MSSKVKELYNKGLIKPPKFLTDNVQYEVIMGSIAYGVSSDNSDMDIYGFAIPPKDIIFPHLTGYVPGFGQPPTRFDQFQKHHIVTEKIEYDLTIYNIIKFFQLCMENNPNMVDALFVPQRCIIHSTQVGQMVRENRHIFLHKGCWHKFKGYAFSQMKKMKSQTREGKRAEVVKKYGYDLKFAYHVVRLMDEVEQILETCDLNLERAKEEMKAIRRGEYTCEQIEEKFARKEIYLEELYNKSSLPYGPDEKQIKRLLLNCLEHHYGNLKNVVKVVPKVEQFIKELESTIEKYK